MTFHRRRLPHIDKPGQTVFITWRLHGSLPPHRAFPADALTSGEAFAAMDRLLEETRSGVFHLKRPEIADMMVEAIRYGADVLKHYRLHAFVVMPNHVHLLCTPAVPLSLVTKSLKNVTGRQANKILATVGKPFWQEESYDHVIRNGAEFDRIKNYIERNPVRARIVSEAGEYPWSSGAGPTRASAPQQAFNAVAGSCNIVGKKPR